MVPSAEYLHFFDDFVGDPSSNAPPGWSVVISTGATVVTSDEHGGVLQFTSDGVDEGAVIHMEECVQLTGKKFFLEARVKVEDADDNIVAIGLTAPASIAANTPADAYDTTQADVIAFGTTVDADPTPVLTYDKNNGGIVTETPTGTSFDLADNTWHTIAIAYNGATTPGNGSLTAYVDGKLAAYAATAAQVPEDVALAPFFYGGVEDDATDLIQVDYVRFVVER
jgi:hypothetical protein